MLIRSDDRFIFLSKTGIIRYVGTFGDYLDSLVLNQALQGAMGIQGVPGVDGSAGVAPYFEAYTGVPSPINAGNPTVIQYDTLLIELNSPGFNTGDYSHLPVPSVYQELWHYSIAINSNTSAEMWAILRHKNSLTEVKRVKLVPDFQVTLNAYHVWTQGDNDPLQVVCFSPTGDSTINSPLETYWQGARIADLTLEQPPQQFVFDGQVANEVDNAHQRADGANFGHSTVQLRVEPAPSDTARWNCGYLIRNVTIPQGATITQAYGEIQWQSSSRDSPRLSIFGNLVSSANDFSVESTINNRVLTAASVPWSDDNMGHSTFVQTPPLVPIIQEIVNQPGWASGNDICLLFFADTSGPELNRMHNLGSSPPVACKLHITAQT